MIGLQDDPEVLIKATDVALLRAIDLPVRRILDVLAEMQMLVDDRTPAVETWFAQRTGEFPNRCVTRAIREDRILHEANATRGDTRALTDLFGLSIKAASRYTDTVDHPSFASISDD
jgi:hypothetical protein